MREKYREGGTKLKTEPPPCFQDLQRLFYDMQYGKWKATDINKHVFLDPYTSCCFKIVHKIIILSAG